MVDRCRVKLSSSTQETLFFSPLLPGRHNTAKRMKGLSKTWTVILKGFRNEQVFEEKTHIDVAAYLSNTQQEPFSSLTYDVYRFLKKCNLSFFILRRKKEINDLLSQ